MENLGPEYPRPTRRSGHRYFFYIKHHNQAASSDAQWLRTLTHDEEFAVFELADDNQIANNHGDLFGLRVGPSGKILDLGERNEQIAEFPFTRPGEVWHGYPMWPLKRASQVERQRQPAPREALDRMVATGLLTRAQRAKFVKGRHI